MLALGKKMCVLFLLMMDNRYYASSYFSFRSASRNSARNYALWQTPTEQNSSKVGGKISLIGQWSSNFNDKNIAKALFNGIPQIKDEPATLTFTGSLSDNRSDSSILADYFYLPTDFNSKATIKPSIDMFIASPSFRINLDAWHKGLYCVINSSFVHMKTDLHFKEKVIEPGLNGYKEGYIVSNKSLTRSKLLNNASDYFSGETVQNNSTTVFESLNFARIPSNSQTHNGIADTYITLGYDHTTPDKSYSLGIAGHIALPTGNRVKGRTLLEPTVGNGHHWEAGISINGYYTLWQHDEHKHFLSLIGDIYVGHLFKCEQTRVFDLLNRPLSRYMLAMELEQLPTSTQTLETSSAPGSVTGSKVPYQFAQHYMPLANATALKVDVSSSVQTDIIAMINLNLQQWSFNIGGNVWCKSKDKLSFATPPTFNVALKGDAQIYGYVDNSDESIVLSATQSKATTFSGLRFTKTSSLVNISVLQNNNIDNANFAVIQDPETIPIGPTIGLTYAPNAAASPTTYINTSNPPIFVTMNDLDIDGAKTSSFSYKLFYNVQYTLETTSIWKPVLGIGGEAEWGQQSSHNRSSLSQWSIWAHCSFGF